MNLSYDNNQGISCLIIFLWLAYRQMAATTSIFNSNFELSRPSPTPTPWNRRLSTTHEHVLPASQIKRTGVFSSPQIRTSFLFAKMFLMWLMCSLQIYLSGVKTSLHRRINAGIEPSCGELELRKYHRGITDKLNLFPCFQTLLCRMGFRWYISERCQ